MATERRVAVVTGGSRGVGRATIERLAAQGYAVAVDYLHDRRMAESVVDLVLARGGDAVAVRADVGDELDMARLLAETRFLYGGVDVVVHTAGAGLLHTWVTVAHQARRELADGGALIDVASSDATATGALTRSWAAELLPRGITVVAVLYEPGRPCVPDRIAGIVALLAGGRGPGLTGQVILV